MCATSTRRVVATPLALRYRQSRSSISSWLRQIYVTPLPHVAALTVVRRCRGAARRDVTARGVLRSATLLLSPRRIGNVKFRTMDLIYDAAKNRSLADRSTPSAVTSRRAAPLQRRTTVKAAT